MPGRNFLFVPGPTNTPDRILRAMHVPMEDHRSSSFPDLAGPLLRDLRKIFKTEQGQVIVFPGTGTGGWESALVNTLSPGDKVLSFRYGQFSHLWIDMMQRLGLDVTVVDVEWGDGAPPEMIQDLLAKDTGHAYKALCVVHNETATGVTSDIGAVRRAMDAARHPALLFVDSVSGLASIDFRMDEWKVDVAITGSQKGFMLPAGAGIVCVSPRALEQGKTARLPRCYWSFEDMVKANATGYFPYTPSIPMLYGLRESVTMLLEEGLENVFARHHRLAEGCRRAVAAWGLNLCARAPRWYSDTVSAIMVPSGFNGADVIDVAYRRYNFALGAGLNKVAGKLFRIGHLGDLNEITLLAGIGGTELAMHDVGIKVELGSGTAAAQRYWIETAKPLPPRKAAGSPDAATRAAEAKRPAGAGAAA
ncbi:MAG TPA: aminotransferase class V-fold PLP-dependent enzyme [Gemmatimonadales bacterium]|nr:aminotransferase class V-fold PLP-dependent enzyme [Gemmatimonadales bacterium]